MVKSREKQGMGQVGITINGRKYEIACEEGQEERLTRLGAYVDERTSELVKSVGNVGDARLMVMTGLLVADKLFDAFAEVEKLRAEIAQTKQTPAPANADDKLAPLIDAIAERIEDIAANLENT
jgi:cell division protein ZapA